MKRHKDIDYAVDDWAGNEKIFKDLGDACAFAVLKAMTTGSKVDLDVLVHSESGARAIEGDIGVEQYREDPDASVYKRIVIKADDQGRVA